MEVPLHLPGTMEFEYPPLPTLTAKMHCLCTLCLYIYSIYSYYTATKLCYRFDISIIFYLSSRQHTAAPIHFVAVPQCSSCYRDGNTGITTYHNADVVVYEWSLSLAFLHPLTLKKTKQTNKQTNKTKQNKTKQNKTKQNKTNNNKKVIIMENLPEKLLTLCQPSADLHHIPHNPCSYLHISLLLETFDLPQLLLIQDRLRVH